MEVEDVIETTIGRSGRYQLWIFFLISIGRFPTEYQLTNVVFILPNPEYVCKDEGANNASNFCPCNNPEYDTSNVMNSVSSEWDLICDKRHLASLGQSMLQIGILAGSIFYGHISDRYGRKIACLLALTAEVFFVAISAAVTEFWMFAVCRFFIGVAVGGTMLCCYIIVIELFGKSFRPYLPGLIEMSYIISYLSLPLIAYFLRDWKHLQLVTSLPWVFVLLYYYLIPESPRWLITMGRKKEAIELLTFIAKKNNMPIEDIEATVVRGYMAALHEERKEHASYLDLFKTPKIRRYTLIIAFIWLCCAHTFFGINQYIGRLQGNIYVNVALSATSLIPGIVLVVLASLYLKRKTSVITSFSVAAISLLLFIVIPRSLETVTRVLAIIGMIGAYTSFVQIYLYSSEIFPTVIRNSAMGFASVFARFGGFIAPFVVNIGVEWVSILIFSVLAMCAASLCIFLPETKETVLLNTIEQTENKNELDHRENTENSKAPNTN
ncbi:organic cation transporter protein-like [Zerene cesonia]|uniref:organic cation transporter protein-like n=1 Tax=Zerene cesonia TaxID=33412 RepID=UPI0018E5589B|nr:organic cation transporter protein-like [Zerene cesonia]